VWGVENLTQKKVITVHIVDAALEFCLQKNKFKAGCNDTHLQFQLLRRLRQKDGLSSGVRDQPGQCSSILKGRHAKATQTTPSMEFRGPGRNPSVASCKLQIV
jgi:hypothetical protein